jgi:hypothetical protein
MTARGAARLVTLVLVIACTAPLCEGGANAAVDSQAPRGASGPRGGAGEAGSLEAAAAKAGSTGRTVAMSLIGLALAVSATVLAFKRDFKEAAGMFAVGLVAVLLATPTGVSLLRGTVSSLFGGP